MNFQTMDALLSPDSPLARWLPSLTGILASLVVACSARLAVFAAREIKAWWAAKPGRSRTAVLEALAGALAATFLVFTARPEMMWPMAGGRP